VHSVGAKAVKNKHLADPIVKSTLEKI
jgi:Ca2+-binding EF-hand superfamily protein